MLAVGLVALDAPRRPPIVADGSASAVRGSAARSVSTMSHAPLLVAEGDGDYLVRAPLPDGTSVVLRSAVAWPGDGPVSCATGTAWPTDPVVVDEVGVVDVRRHGPTIDLVLDRHVRGWCQLTVGPDEVDDRGSYVGDTEVVWWQDAAAIQAAPPRQRLATARERGVERLTIVVDTREQSPWTFEEHPADVVSEKLDEGDYAVLLDGRPVVVVERKKKSDFASGLMRGRALPQLAALARLPRAAVVVEASYAQVLRSKRITRARMSDLVATAQASYPNVPTVFAGTRDGAEAWTWHFLAAGLAHAQAEARPFPTG